MKKLFVALSLGLVLMGCTKEPVPEVNYERSTEMAILNKPEFTEIQKKIENKETFMFVLTMETCSNCQAFKEGVLSKYIKDHGFDFNEVELTDDNIQAVEQFVKENPTPDEYLVGTDFAPTDVLTPGFYFVENGEVKDIFVGGHMTYEEFDRYIVKYQLDKVK